ncbi:hypothetical protein Gotur_034106, partial [Gossypium turneri]
SKNFQEHLEHFVSEQKSRFQVIDKKYLSKSFSFFLSKLLLFLLKISLFIGLRSTFVN